VVRQACLLKIEQPLSGPTDRLTLTLVNLAGNRRVGKLISDAVRVGFRAACVRTLLTGSLTGNDRNSGRKLSAETRNAASRFRLLTSQIANLVNKTQPYDPGNRHNPHNLSFNGSIGKSSPGRTTDTPDISRYCRCVTVSRGVGRASRPTSWPQESRYDWPFRFILFNSSSPCRSGFRTGTRTSAMGRSGIASLSGSRAGVVLAR
jgi:hypothetical protein